MLKNYPEGYDLTLMNTIYRYPRKISDNKWDNGSLDLIIKDNVRGVKFVETIDNPDYEFYMAKPEVKIDYNLFFIEKEKVDKKTVPYKDLLKNIAELTGNEEFYYDNIKNGNRYANTQLHTHERIFMSDMNIEDQYRFRFSNTYKNTIMPISKAFFDIEADTIHMKRDFPEMGECPINAVSMINLSNMTIYVFLLRNKDNPQIQEFEDSIGPDLFKELQDFIIDAVGGIKKAKKLGVDKFKFQFMMYDAEEEIRLIQDLFSAFNTFKPDFILAWNMAFDIPYIIQRIINLGYNPEDIMCHPDFKYKDAKYAVDDRNFNEFAERGDYAMISSYSVYMDQLIQFASRRKGQSAFRSFSLDDIGNVIAGVRKLDYKHITTDISLLPYKAYKIFVFYNIMDTIVQHCIENKTGDIDYIYNKCMVNNTRYSKGHRQTVYLANRGALEFYKNGFIMGNNTNKSNSSIPFDGAFVAEPSKNSDYSKVKINGQALNVFKNLDDFDYTRLYPSIMQEFNMAPNTQIGKVFVQDLKGNMSEADKFMEDLQSHVYLEFFKRWLNLAGYEELYDDIVEYFTTIMPASRRLRTFTKEGHIIPLINNPKGIIKPIYHLSEGETIKPIESYKILSEDLMNKIGKVK